MASDFCYQSPKKPLDSENPLKRDALIPSNRTLAKVRLFECLNFQSLYAHLKRISWKVNRERVFLLQPDSMIHILFRIKFHFNFFMILACSRAFVPGF